MRNVLKVTVLGHIHRGMSPIPRVIRAVVGVEHIIARILKILSRLLGFLHISANLNVVLAGHSAVAEALHLGLNRVTKRYGIVLAASFLDSLDYLCRKAIAVLKAAAVLVLTLVEKLYCELVKKISLVYRVYLNSVNACVAAELCGLCKRLNDLVDLLLCHLGALNIVRPTRGLRAGGCKLVRGIKYRLQYSACKFVLVQGRHKLGDRPRAAHSRGKLNEKLRSRLMYLVHKLL